MAYDDLKDDLRGVAFTNPTPFSDDDEDVLHDELTSNLEYIADAGGQVIIPCGNTGEYYSLSTDERIDVVRTSVDAVGDRMAVVGGAGGSTKDALHLISAYEDADADAVLVMHPVHTFVHEAGVREYYRTLAESTNLGLVLYKRGPELSAGTIAELSTLDNVVAVKYAVNDVKGFAATVTETPGDIVFSNGIAERFAISFAAEGAEGYTTGMGNFAPEATLALMDALRDGDQERAREIRDLLWPFEDLREEPGADSSFSAANNVPAVKYALELAGLYGGPVRAPLVELADEDKERARRYFEAIRDAGF